MMQRIRFGAAIVAFVVACTLVGGPAAAGSGRAASAVAETKPLIWADDPDGDGPIRAGDRVAGSAATIWRDADGVRFRIVTTGLEKGHGVTAWFFAYNEPTACTTGAGTPGYRCTRGDLFNPAVRGSLMWGRSGLFVEGPASTFRGGRPINPLPCASEPATVTDDCDGTILGNGLSNPLGAEIHFVLRDHGPDQPDVDDEITTINGGCDPVTFHGIPVFGPGWGTPGNFACHDPQLTTT